MEHLVEHLEKLITPLINEYQMDLYDIELHSQRLPWLLRIYVFRKKGGITIDEMAHLSREISSLLDLEDPISVRYTLEVFTAGIERKLSKPQHYQWAMGETIHVVLKHPLEGRTAIDGILVQSNGEAILLREKTREWKILIRAIKRAKVRYTWH